jgi:hypothetical protein
MNKTSYYLLLSSLAASAIAACGGDDDPECPHSVTVESVDRTITSDSGCHAVSLVSGVQSAVVDRACRGRECAGTRAWLGAGPGGRGDVRCADAPCARRAATRDRARAQARSAHRARRACARVGFALDRRAGDPALAQCCLREMASRGAPTRVHTCERRCQTQMSCCPDGARDAFRRRCRTASCRAPRSRGA